MPVPRLSTLTMSLDLLDEITRRSNTNNQFEADSTNPEKTMVCLQNGFGDELQHSSKYSMRRNVIPYPDHNYGQPPPPTPPEPASPDQNEQTDTGNEEEDETGITRCICGFEHTDEYMICCDKCSSWQHIECMGIKSDNVPETYLCNSCQPRALDVERAKVIQSKKKEEMSDDDNDDDDDTESEEDQAATMYTAVSSTPTRITLTANTLSSTKKKVKGRLKKTEEGDGKRKRRNGRKRPRTDTGSDLDLRVESSSVDSYISYFEAYRDIDSNKYHPSVEAVQLKALEVEDEVFAQMLANRLCRVHNVDESRKGLLAMQDIEENKPVLEYKGMVMLLSAFEEVNPFFRRRHPYVLFYNGLDHMQLAVDARTSGNESRFVRRSCEANAEVRHVQVKGLLRFVIYSKKNIQSQSEVTIPFDFPVDSYDGRLECPCKKETCPVAKLNMKFKTYDHRKKTKLSNGESTCRMRKVSPLGPSVSENQLESESDDNEVESSSGSRRRRKLSREEKKLQTYMKQFEKMEKEEKKGGTVVTTKDTKDLLKDGRLPQFCRLPDGTSPRDENGVIQNAKMNRRSTGKRRVSMHKSKRSRLSSCSSEPLSPAEDSNSSTTPTTPLTVSTALSPIVDINGLLKQKLKKEKDPLTLSLLGDKVSPNVKILARKAKKEGLDIVTGSPTPPATPGQGSPTGKVPSTPVDAQSISQSPDVNSESPSFTSSMLTPACDRSSLGCGLLQIADHFDDTGSKSNSPGPSSVSSIGLVTAEELVSHMTSRDDLFCEDTDSNSCIFKTPLQVTSCKYFGSMKKHWLQLHVDCPTAKSNSHVNGISHLPLSTLMSTQGIRDRATQIASKSLSRSSVSGSLKKKRLHEIFGYNSRTVESSCELSENKSIPQRSYIKASLGISKNDLLHSSLGQIAHKFMMANPIRDSISSLVQPPEIPHSVGKTLRSAEVQLNTPKSVLPIRTEPLLASESTSSIVTTSNITLKTDSPESSSLRDPRQKINDVIVTDSDSLWRDEKPAPITGLLSTDSLSNRYSSTSSRDSIESVGFTRSDSVSSVEESGSSRADRERGKKKMSLSEYRNRQRARPTPASVSVAPVCLPASSEVIVSQVAAPNPQSIFSDTDSLLIPRTVSLSNSYVTGLSPVKVQVPVSVSSTNSSEMGPPNGPVFEPVSPSDVEHEGAVVESGMHFISTQSFAYPSTAVVSTTSLIHPMQRSNASHQDGSNSDAMDIEDEETVSTAGIQVGIPNSDVTSLPSLTHSTLGSQPFTSPRLVLSTNYDSQMTLHHHYTGTHGNMVSSRKADLKMYDFQTPPSKRSQQAHTQSFHG